MVNRPEVSKNDNRVFHSDVDRLCANAEKKYWHPYPNVLIGIYRFEDGWTEVEVAACIDAENYDEKIGEEIIDDKIKDKMWKLEGYVLNRNQESK